MKVCSLTGDGFIHSIEADTPYVLIVPRVEARLSQIIHINMITETKEIREPREETMFHGVKASG